MTNESERLPMPGQFHRYLDHMQRDNWFAPLRGGFPQVPIRDVLPSASADFRYRLVSIRGTPDITYQCLRDSGGTWNWEQVAPPPTIPTVPDAVERYARSVTTQDVVNTVTETSVFSFSVVGGDLGTNKAIRVTMVGDHLNNSGANTTLGLKVTFGATTVWADTSVAIGSSATRRAWHLQVVLGNQDSASAQALGGVFGTGPSTAPTTGTGDLNTTFALNAIPIFGTAAENTASSKTLDFLFTHGNAHANISIRRFLAYAELV